MTSSPVHVPLSSAIISSKKSLLRHTQTHIFIHISLDFGSIIQVLRAYRTSTAIRHRPTFESLPEHRTRKVLRNPPTPPQISAQKLTHYWRTSRQGLRTENSVTFFITQILKAALSLSMYVVFSFNSMGLFVGGWFPMIFHWLLCIQHQ